MIGLRRGMVSLVPHSAAWEKVFRREEKKLRQIPGVIAVEHIGSTSIPKLSAKPIIDILVGVKTIRDFHRRLRMITQLGYEQKKNLKFGNRRYFFTLGRNDLRTVHLHVERYQGAKWKKDIAFRDWLRTHPRDRKRYERIKLGLEKQHPEDRKRYTVGKQKFISSLLRTIT